MRRFLLGLGFASTVAVLAGCPVSPPALCDYGACDPPDGAVLDGGDSGFDAPPGCDLTKDPKDSLPCVTESVGIFVSSTGSDTNDGSKAKPVATIGKALSLIGTKPRIYVCEGNYPGSIDIAKTVGIYGGFKCDWTPSATKPVLLADKPAYAVKITQPNVSLVDLDIQGKDATAPGESSIGVFASSASGLKLRRAAVSAGIGFAAAKPADIADFSGRAPDGNPGDVNNGGGKKDNACSNGTGTSTGAFGGGPTGGGADGANGVPFATYPVNPAGASGAKGVAGIDCSTGLGRNGSYGPGGGAGSGAAKLGTLSVTGWASQSGTSATAGQVGQGGGGGASLDTTGGGGGGGSGGCGGVAGQGGGGGGASIAIVLVDSAASLESLTLTSKNAGDGAQGGTGQKAQEGGFKGNGFGNACQAGVGGHGGSGGGGGGGAGGVSAGVLYSGAAPTIDGKSTPSASTLPNVTLGKEGAAGAAGQGGPAFKTTAPASNPGTNGTAGVVGVAQAVLLAP